MRTLKLLGATLVVLGAANLIVAAPWDRADRKINGYSQGRVSQRSYSYSPSAVAAPSVGVSAVAPSAVAAPAPVRPAAPAVQSPATRAPTSTSVVQNQVRSYRRYSYPSGGTYYNYNNNVSRGRQPFYMRADSKVLGRQGW